MLSERLAHCLAFAKGYNALLDVGTDHAYLPIAAVKAGIVTRAVAVDNKQGPLTIARDNIKAFSLEDKVTTKLSSGIESLEDEDVVIIAGLGGKMIYESLNEKDYRNVKRFILQPQNHAEKVRLLTRNNNLKIVDEVILLDNDIPYTIIVLELGSQRLSEEELWFGPILLKEKSALLKSTIDKEINFIEGLIDTIPRDARVPLEKKLAFLKEVVHEWNQD